MKFFKPKFWDQSEISFFSIFLYPITIFFKLLNLIKYLTIKPQNFSIPIICVGNIYVGGTGKTPLCVELYSILQKMNKKPVFIRKKYRAFKDEVTLLSQTGIVYEEKKRIIALNNAIKNKTDIAILDDGFQDLSINKNLSIICFNEKKWIGNGLMMPSGPLREDISALRRANLVIINGKNNNNIEKKILETNNKIKIFYSTYKPKNIDEFKNNKVVAFAGIGNPDNFFNLLKENNVNVLESINFPDHYNYSDKEIEDLINKAKKNDSYLLTTEKDWLRINKNFRKNIKFLKLKIEIKNENGLVEEIKKFI